MSTIAAFANDFAPGVGAVAIVLVFLNSRRVGRRRAMRIHPGARPLPGDSANTKPGKSA